MKVLHLIVGIFIVNNVRGDFNILPDCIELSDLDDATKTACVKNTDEMWLKIMKCHDPISEEDLRNSDEATCGCPFTIDTTDTKYSMVKVFQNICKTVPGINNNTVANVALGKACILGKHPFEAAKFKNLYGSCVPCNIGICTNKIFGFAQKESITYNMCKGQQAMAGQG